MKQITLSKILFFKFLILISMFGLTCCSNPEKNTTAISKVSLSLGPDIYASANTQKVSETEWMSTCSIINGSDASYEAKVTILLVDKNGNLITEGPKPLYSHQGEKGRSVSTDSFELVRPAGTRVLGFKQVNLGNPH